MDKQRSTLCVSLHNVEFAKDYHYFITVKIDGSDEKFAAFIVTYRDNTAIEDLENKGQARLLGEAVLELGGLTGPLTDISGSGVRQNLRFSRIQGEKDVTVGRFVVNLKLVGDEVFPLEESDLMPQFSQADTNFDFLWRLRVDIRSGVDMPTNKSTSSGLPSCYIELGWTLYDNQPPDDQTIFLTQIADSNRHPIWNQQFLIANPKSITNKEGFLYISVKDKHSVDAIDNIFIPLKPMKPFLPYNLEFFSTKAEYEARGKLYVSVVLEMANKDSFQDSLADIVIKNIHHDPLPYANKMNLLMVLENYKPKNVEFTNVDLKGPTNIAKIIEDASAVNVSSLSKSVFISPVLKIPPHKTETNYNAVCTFTLPRSYLDSNIKFYLAGRDDNLGSYHSMPNSIVGNSDIVDDQLKRLFYSKTKEAALIPITWHKESSLFPVFSTTRGIVELGVVSLDEAKISMKEKKSKFNMGKDNFDDSLHNKLDNILGSNIDGTKSEKDKWKVLLETKKFDDNPEETMNDKLAHILGTNIDGSKSEKEKWQILSRELAQKQEIIHRMIKEIDDKTDALKITGAEIVDLRRQIKMLQSENVILRKRLAIEEQVEISSLVTKEISKMSVEELKAKIIKIAQAYRDERVRNEEFSKSLKSAQQDLAQTRQLQTELETLRNAHKENSKKLLKMQSEIQRVALYKETIKKQEKVISKLEKLLENSLQDTEKARGSLLDLEQIRSENITLQKQIKQIAYGSEGENSEVERYKRECEKLERIVYELREELKSKRPSTSYGDDNEKEKIELEVKLHKCQCRVEALQEEMTENARNFAKEISNLKMIIAEKQALLDTLTYDM